MNKRQRKKFSVLWLVITVLAVISMIAFMFIPLL